MRFAPLLLTIVVAAPSLVRSQEAMIRSWPVAAGSRVRVETPAFGEQEGIAVVVTNDSLVLRVADDSAHEPIPLAQITKLDVSTGAYSRKGALSAVGFLVGAGVGAILGAAAYPKPTCDRRVQTCFDNIAGPGSRRGSAILGGALLGLVGAAVGAMVGAEPRYTWAPVSLPYSMRR
jgi:hypothetical protein